MSSTGQDPRNAGTVEAHVTAEQRALLERAAAYEGKTVSDFVVQSAQQAAQAVVQQREVLRLNPSESRAFVDALLAPRQPNEALREAADAHRRDVASR